MGKTIAVVLGGGQGTRLFPLTSIRSKPAVPLAGKYRLIDIPISNCLNSGINRVFVLTQFMSVSLHNHIRRTYSFDHFGDGFVDILAAQETATQGSDWFQGTADAVRKNLRYIHRLPYDYVLILSGDQLYRMNFRELIRQHEKTRADVTIACRPVSRDDARNFGIMRIDETGQVIGFLEKPQTEEEFDLVRMDPAWITAQGIKSLGCDCLASLGIYLFNRQTLEDVLQKTDYRDFGKEVFPATIRSRHVHHFVFEDYWEDIGTIRSFYEANLSLASETPPFDFHTTSGPVYSRARYLPPSRISHATISNSLIADGCNIGDGAVIENSVVGLRCQIGRDAVIRNSIIMGTDYYEDEQAYFVQSDQHECPIGIGDGSVIEGAIVDKNCRIGRNVRVVNDAGWESTSNEDPVCVVRDGIPVVIKNSTIPDNWTLAELQAEVATG